jgi:hypothetical protein
MAAIMVHIARDIWQVTMPCCPLPNPMTAMLGFILMDRRWSNLLNRRDAYNCRPASIKLRLPSIKTHEIKTNLET